MSQFLNGALRRLTPYTPGEQPRNQAYIKLNTNESPYPPSPGVLAALNRAEGENLRLYSDPEAVELREALAARYRVERESVFVANGSDEALSFAFLAYAADGRGVAFPDISYGFYAVFARLYGIPVRQVPLRADFRLAPEDYNHLHRTIVLANPNAPTGLALSRDEVEGIVRANPDAVVVVDEAYVDFGGESAVPLTARYPNLLVVQTFSKSRSMAGARLGYAIGDAALIQDLEAIRFSTNPYNVNRLTLRTGAAALAEQDYYDANCAAIVDTAPIPSGGWRRLASPAPTPGRTSSLPAIRQRTAGTSTGGSRSAGCWCAASTPPASGDYIRITIGTRAQMDALLERLEGLL